ncbi:MAG: adenylate/guanylate cyclase domain-containing protein [Anaerolineales bacterium]|jgi:class 3 adenylate cyclase
MDLTSIFNRPPRILVADDDWLNRDLLKAYLDNSGCEVAVATEGQSALKLALENPPDLILLDVQMPVMDGLTLCGQLKQDLRTQFVPVVIVTALDSEEEKLRAIEAGADDFITKPYNAIVLLTRVRSLLRLKKLNDDVEARNRLLRQALDRFLAEDVTDIILTDPERYLQLGGEVRLVTILFVDIRGFTRYTERHTGPEVITTLNRIFEQLSQVVFTHRGTFDKYLGDGLMAFYGAPVSGEDDAQRALATAVEMMYRFRQLCAEAGEDLLGLDLGIGLHSGEVVVGNVGSEKIMDYTVIGDPVNVAKRLQEVAQGGEILISEATYAQVRGIRGTRLPDVSLSGRQEPVTVYRVDGLTALD